MPHPRPNRLLTFFLLLPLLAVPVAAGAEEIHAKLIGYQEVPSVSTVARGEFRAEISRDGSAIDWELSFSGLQAPVTQAHIHFGQRSVIGGIVIWLCQTATNPAPASVTALTQTCPQSGNITGTATAANVVATAANQQIAAGELAEVIAAIRARVAYANVHTLVSPGGEIRGQIKASDRD